MKGNVSVTKNLGNSLPKSHILRNMIPKTLNLILYKNPESVNYPYTSENPNNWSPNFLKMANNTEKTVVDLAEKFRNAVIELGDVDEAVIHNIEGGERKEGDDWEAMLVGKIMIEGTMGLKSV